LTHETPKQKEEREKENQKKKVARMRAAWRDTYGK
tara:strand:- start:448 stop:552 length:105 start_codon:yes stop_codon:yes gene_type:complete